MTDERSAIEALAVLFDQARIAEWERIVAAHGVRPGFDRAASHKASTEAGIAAVIRRLQPARVPEFTSDDLPESRYKILGSGTYNTRPFSGYRGCDVIDAVNEWARRHLLSAAPAAEGGKADTSNKPSWYTELATNAAETLRIRDRLQANPAPESREAREICGKETGTTCANPNCYACTQYDAERSRNAGVQRWTLDEAPKCEPLGHEIEKLMAENIEVFLDGEPEAVMANGMTDAETEATASVMGLSREADENPQHCPQCRFTMSGLGWCVNCKWKPEAGQREGFTLLNNLVQEWRTRIPSDAPTSDRVGMREYCADQLEAVIRRLADRREAAVVKQGLTTGQREGVEALEDWLGAPDAWYEAGPCHIGFISTDKAAVENYISKRNAELDPRSTNLMRQGPYPLYGYDRCHDLIVELISARRLASAQQAGSTGEFGEQFIDGMGWVIPMRNVIKCAAFMVNGAQDELSKINNLPAINPDIPKPDAPEPVADAAHAAALAEVLRDHGNVWPHHLPSGVMFWRGERITRQEFEAAAGKGGA